MSKRLGGIIGCKYKTSSWPLYGSNIRSTLFVCETHFFFFSSHLYIADGPHHYYPACGYKGSSHLSPVHALQFFIFVRCEQTHHKRTAEKCSRAKKSNNILCLRVGSGTGLHISRICHIAPKIQSVIYCKNNPCLPVNTMAKKEDTQRPKRCTRMANRYARSESFTSPHLTSPRTIERSNLRR